MFSETIFINHGHHEMISVNGHEAQNGHRELRSESCESFSGSESSSMYKSHMLEKKYSVERLQQQGHRAESQESVQEVSCFVRSEIKWVFLKSVKVQTIKTKRQARAVMWQFKHWRLNIEQCRTSI